MRHRTLDLQALQSFVTVVSTGGFSAAARQLNYSQSAVSMQLKRLEDELGVAVLTRQSGAIRPTRPGLEVLGYAREMLRLDGELQHKLAEREVAGSVRLGVPIDYAPYIPATLTLFAERFPFVEMEVRSEATQRLDAMGRRWRTAYEGQAFATQRIPVSAGLAIAVAIPSLIGPDLTVLDPAEAGLPALPMIDIRLHRSPGRASRAAAYLADLIIERIRDSRNTA